jgi:hypothetical protein
MARKTKSTESALEPELTLRELAGRYTEHLRDGGWSPTTVFAYGAELQLAQSEIGGDTRIADLTPERVAEYFECPRVTRLKGGKKRKSPLSVAKSCRVLRLSLVFAEQQGWIAKAPLPSAQEPTVSEPVKPERKPRNAKRSASDVPSSDVAPPAESNVVVTPEATAA